MRATLGKLRRRASILSRRPRIGVHMWLRDNPYSDVIYSEFTGAAAPEQMSLLEELAAFTALPAKGRLLWIHSEASYSWGNSGPALERAYRSYLGSLDRWADKGGALAWTVHDDGLHLSDPDPERIATIRQRLRDRAGCVHVHSNAAAELISRDFGIARDRIAVIPHPSYASLYPATPGGTPLPDARGRRRLLCFGHIKPYKDYDGFAAALARLPGPGFASLTLAGKKSRSVTLPLDVFEKSVELDLRLRFIPDEEVPGLFAGAHFLVLPYIESLTSGAAALSMGFGVPIIAPALGGMREAVPAENHPLLYDPKDPDGLAGALAAAAELTEADYAALHAACAAFGAAIHPERISTALLQMLQERKLFSIT